MIVPGEVNLPQVKAEVEAAFREYEAALMDNDLDTLDAHFWHDPRVVRYGVTENLYGIEAIRAYRRARDTAGVARLLSQTRITTFGVDTAIATTEFKRLNQAPGRQTQLWMRLPEGWRIVSAHVSLLEVRR
jgi:ketosteroid isomerase-like protein